MRFPVYEDLRHFRIILREAYRKNGRDKKGKQETNKK